MTRWLLVCSTLALPLEAQDDIPAAVAGLFDEDWRRRNNAARSLAADAELDLALLLHVVKAEYASDRYRTGSVAPIVYYGGRGYRSRWAGALAPPGLEYFQSAGWLPDPVVEPSDLVLPLGTRLLAAWVLQRQLAAGTALDTANAAVFRADLSRVVEQAEDEGLRVQAALALSTLQLPELDDPLLRSEGPARAIVHVQQYRSPGGGSFLHRLVQEGHGPARAHAMNALSAAAIAEVSETRAAILRCFLEAERGVAAHAGPAVLDLGDAAMPALIAACGHHGTETRRRALDQLLRRGKAARPAATAVIGLVGDPDEKVALWAPQVLAAMELEGDVARQAVQVLTGRFPDAARDEKVAIFYALGHMGDAADDKAVELLARGARTRSNDWPWFAPVCVRSLRFLGRADVLSVHELESMLRATDAGPEAAAALPLRRRGGAGARAGTQGPGRALVGH